jgi:hypothetical protein
MQLTVKLDILPHNSALGLVVLVDRHLDLAALNSPSTHAADEVLEFFARQVKPRLEDALVNLTHSLADSGGNAHAHQLLEARDIGDEVGVQVVRVQGRPEGSVVGALEQVPQLVQLLNGFRKRGVAGGGVVGGRGEGREGVDGQQRQAEGEVGAGKDGEGLDEDVGDGLVAGEVRVELVAAVMRSVVADRESHAQQRAGCCVQIELI